MNVLVTLCAWWCREEGDGRLDPAGRSGEAGFSTAELLGNAALGIAALVVIWAALTGVGEQVITYIQSAILGG